MISFPFDSRVTYDGDIPTYDRAVSSEPLRKLLKDLFTTGVMPNPSTCFQVSEGLEGMTVRVSPGYAVIEGGLMVENETRTLEITAADTTNDRIDTVVLRWNSNIDARIADLYVLAGTPAADPVRPTLTRTSSIYEIGLADIFIPANSTNTNDERITDTRYESERCGIVSSVSEWDTTTIYQQVQADLANFKSEEQVDFIEWFNEMKDQLSEDAAGHLQLEIDALNQPFTGATSLLAGAKGLVPAPSAGDENKVLKGDGTWGIADEATVRYDAATQWIQCKDSLGWFNWRKVARALWDWITDSTPLITWVRYQNYLAPTVTRTSNSIQISMTPGNDNIANAIFQTSTSPITVHIKGVANNLLYDSASRYFALGYCDWDGSNYSNVVRSHALPASGSFEFDVTVPANKYFLITVAQAYASDRYVTIEECYATT